MRFKALLYTSIITLLSAVAGTLMRYMMGIELGEKITEYAMSLTQVVGLLLLVLNGKVIYQSKVMMRMGIAALVTLAGYFLIYFSLGLSIAAQLLGIAAIFGIYLRWFLKKEQKLTLDFLKLIWVFSRLVVSAFVVLRLSNIGYITHFSNIFFYTMLIYFIWFTLTHYEAISNVNEVSSNQPS